MKTVLVIEDQIIIRENACDMLELAGYKVISADNGKDGIYLAKQIKPDLILCDIMLPESDGYEIFTILQNDASTVQIPFVFLTASAQKREIEEGLGMGAVGYIKKPFEPQDFYETIARSLAANSK